mgnify:CR=1 FL=1
MADDARETGSPLNPTPAAKRIASIDVLRGFALLGILVMNIPTFAYIEAAWLNPNVQGTDGAPDRIAWLISHLFFDLKMMAIFSMLFGTGIVMIRDRARERGRGPRVHYRRMLWLLLIGLAHAYLIWEGDILVAYAMCGMLLYVLARLRPRWLIPIGLALMLGAPVMNIPFGRMLEQGRELSLAAQADDAIEFTKAEQQLVDAYEDARKDFEFEPESFEKQAATFTGSYADRFAPRAKASLAWQTFLFLVWGVWRVGGLIVLGMGLFKLGLFSAHLAARTYALLAVIGYAAGLPVIWFGAKEMINHNYDFVYLFQIGWWYNYAASILVALAHVSVVMLICRAGVLTPFRNALSAVGRMALTNYLAQSIICALLFYGYGFALWGRLSRAELLAVVAAIWTAQLLWSPLWLARFRFGPMEWAWRSLTYWKRHPMRIDSRD